jgi:hypothetical protein
MAITSRSLTFTATGGKFKLQDFRDLVEETKNLKGSVSVGVTVSRWTPDSDGTAYAVVTWKDSDVETEFS